MTIRISKFFTIISSVFIIFITLSVSRFMGMSGIFFPEIFYNDLGYISLLVVSVVYLFFLFFSVESLGIYTFGQYRWLIVGFLSLLVIEIIYTNILWGVDLSIILKESMYYYTPILAYTVLYGLNKYIEIGVLLKRIIVVAAIIISLVSIVAFLLLQAGNDILRLGASVSIRYGSVRFDLANILFILGYFISLSELLKSTNKNWIYKFAMVLVLVNLTYISKGRSQVLYVAIATVVGFIISRRVTNEIKWLVTVLSGIGIVVFVTNKLPILLRSLVSTDAGVAIRFDEIRFYVNQIFEHPLLGMGFLPGDSPAVIGPYGMYYQSDVGLIGFTNLFGFVGLIWLISWFIKSAVLISKQKNDSADYYCAYMLLIYLLVSSISLCMMDYNKTILLPIAMILFENINSRNESGSQLNIR